MTFSLRFDQTKSTHRVHSENRKDIELPNRFLRALELRGLSRHSIRAYGYDLVVFLRWMEQRRQTLKSLTETHVMEFIAFHRERNAAAKTINRRLIACRLLYQFAFDKPIPSGHRVSRPSRHFMGMLYDPYLGIIRVRRRGRLKMRVKEPKRVIDPLTTAQVNAFLRRVSRHRDIVIALLMLLCGLRSAEVISLRIMDVNFTERQLRVKGKGNKERIVPLPELLIKQIQKYLKLERPLSCKTDCLLVILQGARRGGTMTASGLRSLFRQRRKTEILSAVHPHKMRHTFGADMARSGVSLPSLQRMMGHSTPVVTRDYIELSVDDIKEEYDRAIEKLKSRYEPNA